MSFNEFPKTLYRYDAETGAKLGKTFSSAEAVEKGWVSHDDLGPAPAIKAQPQVPASAVEAGKRLVAAEADNAHLKDSVKLYEDFLANIRDDANCPEDIKGRIIELIGAAPETAKPKRKK